MKAADHALIPKRPIKTISARAAASTGNDSSVRMWETATGVETRTLTGHTDWTWCAAFSSDGKVSAGNDGTILLWA